MNESPRKPDAAPPPIRDYSLYESVKSIPGWLHEVTAFRTIDILEWQARQGIRGNLMEIGVFCGRYLSLLVHSAIRDGGSVLGIDTFEFAPEERVFAELDTALNTNTADYLTLWPKSSSTVLPNEITGKMGRLRFISIDGAHDYENVFRDLVLSEQVLAPDGIIAADDFLNPQALGVNAAINRFLDSPRAVVPVAYISNKLFLAHRSMEDDYRQAIEEMIRDGEEPQSANFREKILQGRHHVEQEFHGHKVLLS